MPNNYTLTIHLGSGDNGKAIQDKINSTKPANISKNAYVLKLILEGLQTLK